MSTNAISEKTGVLAEWRDGWLAVLVGVLGMGYSVTHVYSLGMFASPLKTDLNWSTSEVYSGLSIGVIAAVIALPFVGIIVDRWGTRRVGLISVPLFGLALAALSFGCVALWVWWVNWLILSVAATFAGGSLWAAEVSRLFDKARGTALAVALSGGSLIQIILPPLCLMLIENYGWRQAYVVLGIGGLVLLTPLVFLLKSPSDGGVVNHRADNSSIGWKVCRDTKLIILSLCALLVIGTLSSLVNLFVPMLVFGGLSRAVAAASAGTIGIGCLIGGLISGALLDRLNKRWVAAVFFAIPLVPCIFILTQGSSHLSTVPFLPFGTALLFGLSLGADLNIFAVFTALYFELKHYGFFFSVIVAMMSLGVGLGSFFLAKAFDITGSYDLALGCAVSAFLIPPLLIMVLGKPRLKETGQA